MPSPLVAIAAVVVLGIGAQWLAWRFRLPSILLLLVFGFLAGPVGAHFDLALIPQEALQGNWLFPFVSLAVGIILFEGGLTLRFDELREVGKTVFNLITIGVAVTAVLATLGAHYLVGFSWEVAVVIGALLTVTGPTVVLPLIRHVRPAGRVGTIAKWEGITIDPIGAILAVLVLEAVVLIQEARIDGESQGLGSVIGHLLEGIAFEIVVGVGVAILAAALLILMLRKRLVPDWLQNPVALMTVVAAFALANTLQEEAGLLEATLLGIIMANQKYVSVRRIVEFKEDLRVLLISLLFIVLSARLELSALDVMLAPGPLLFLAALILIVRPLATWLSSLGTGLEGREILFLSWLAPRGIVAAAVASLFSFRLAEFFPAQAERIVPIVFLIIVGTVAVYGLTIAPLARWLGLALPDPQGILFVGAHPWAQKMAAVLEDRGFRVLLVDANAGNVRRANQLGLPAQRANVLAEGVKDDLDLAGIGRMLAITPNDEVNALAALHFGEVFEGDEVYQLSMRAEAGNRLEGEIPRHLRGRPLFDGEATYDDLDERFEHGASIYVLRPKDGQTLDALGREHEGFLPLFIVRGDRLRVVADGATRLALSPDDTVIAVLDAPPGQPTERDLMALKATGELDASGDGSPLAEAPEADREVEEVRPPEAADGA